jgi:hypothetical protein
VSTQVKGQTHLDKVILQPLFRAYEFLINRRVMFRDHGIDMADSSLVFGLVDGFDL